MWYSNIRGENMIVLICGSRDWNDFETMKKFIDTLPVDTTIVEGDCKGADKIGGYLANKRGLKVIREPAKWTKFGEYSGPLRNNAMIHMYEPNLVVAFHNDIQHSKGTKNMLAIAKLCKIQTQIIRSDNV